MMQRKVVTLIHKKLNKFLDKKDTFYPQKHDDSGVHGVDDEKCVWFEVELQGAQGDRKAEGSTQQYMKSGVAKHLGVAGIHQQNGLVDEINVTLFAKVLHEFEFEVEPLRDHTFKVEPQESVDQEADDMDFSYGCKAEIWATKGLLDKSKGNILGMKIVRDQSGNTLKVSQFRFSNEKLVQTLLEGHFMLSLEGSLSRDCDVEKNGKWSCIYAVGSHKYQMICTRLDITSADVGVLDKFDRGLQTDVQVSVDFDYAMGRSITVMGLEEENMAKGTLDRVKI
nr:zinc finger, CCHC-type [Tanacetum cinerariifolium]